MQWHLVDWVRSPASTWPVNLGAGNSATSQSSGHEMPDGRPHDILTLTACTPRQQARPHSMLAQTTAVGLTISLSSRNMWPPEVCRLTTHSANQCDVQCSVVGTQCMETSLKKMVENVRRSDLTTIKWPPSLQPQVSVLSCRNLIMTKVDSWSLTTSITAYNHRGNLRVSPSQASTCQDKESGSTLFGKAI